jgi:hypothetical protein
VDRTQTWGVTAPHWCYQRIARATRSERATKANVANAPQLEGTGEIRVETADRATGYWTTRSDRDAGLNARTAGVYLRNVTRALGYGTILRQIYPCRSCSRHNGYLKCWIFGPARPHPPRRAFVTSVQTDVGSSRDRAATREWADKGASRALLGAGSW